MRKGSYSQWCSNALRVANAGKTLRPCGKKHVVHFSLRRPGLCLAERQRWRRHQRSVESLEKDWGRLSHALGSACHARSWGGYRLEASATESSFDHLCGCQSLWPSPLRSPWRKQLSLFLSLPLRLLRFQWPKPWLSL